MALPILVGNQTATTLSTVLTSGEHIPAHTVVSLGSVAISNITSAVSGSVVSVSNFPSTQTVAGTVTASNLPLVDDNFSSTTLGAIKANLYIQDSLGGSGLLPINNDGTSLPVEIWKDGNQLNTNNTLPISGTVTVGNSITIASLPAISGTVTVLNATTASAVFVKICGEQSGAGSNEAREIQTDDNGFLYVRLTDPSVPGGKAVIYDPVAGNAYVNVRQTSSVTIGNSVTIGSLPAISGTVTANVASTTVTVSALPSGALTTRFGSVTTANTSQITSAVTNTSRKYLLAQNISTGSVTIGIGFSPTTTQGIQLTAGAGLTFDAFCPTGAVYWLGAVTGAAFTILEG